jgi:hypothetical protein
VDFHWFCSKIEFNPKNWFLKLRQGLQRQLPTARQLTVVGTTAESLVSIDFAEID